MVFGLSKKIAVNILGSKPVRALFPATVVATELTKAIQSENVAKPVKATEIATGILASPLVLPLHAPHIFRDIGMGFTSGIVNTLRATKETYENPGKFITIGRLSVTRSLDQSFSGNGKLHHSVVNTEHTLQQTQRSTSPKLLRGLAAAGNLLVTSTINIPLATIAQPLFRMPIRLAHHMREQDDDQLLPTKHTGYDAWKQKTFSCLTTSALQGSTNKVLYIEHQNTSYRDNRSQLQTNPHSTSSKRQSFRASVHLDKPVPQEVIEDSQKNRKGRPQYNNDTNTSSFRSF